MTVRHPPYSLHRYLEIWAVLLLISLFFWIVFGGAASGPADRSQTAELDPYNRIVTLALFVCCIPLMRFRWNEITRLLRANWPLGTLYLYFAFSVTWALDPSIALRRIIAIAIIIAIVVAVMASIRRGPVLHLAIVASCVMVACADLAALAVLGDRAYSHAPEGLIGLQSHKNLVGMVMMVGIIATAPSLAYARRWLGKTAILFGLFAEVAVLVLSRSKTSGAVIVVIAAVVPMIIALSRKSRTVIALTVTAIVLVLVAAVSFYLIVCAMSGADLLAPLSGATFTNRLSIWQFLLAEIGKRPWFGAGYSSFWGIDPNLQPSMQTNEWFSRDIIVTEGHQGYLDLWATGGTVGLIFGLFVIVRSVWLARLAVHRAAPAALAWRRDTLARPAAIFYLGLLLALLIHSFTESDLFGSSGGVLFAGFLIASFDLEKWRASLPHKHQSTGIPSTKNTQSGIVSAGTGISIAPSPRTNSP